MTLKRNLIAATLGLAAIAAAGAASAQTRFDETHPRQAQVLSRDGHLRHEIVAERRAGEISPAKAHRLMIRQGHIAREEHRMSRANGGYITKAEQHRLNIQENRLARHVG
jgi:hypothetical protein